MSQNVQPLKKLSKCLASVNKSKCNNEFAKIVFVYWTTII